MENIEKIINANNHWDFLKNRSGDTNYQVHDPEFLAQFGISQPIVGAMYILADFLRDNDVSSFELKGLRQPFLCEQKITGNYDGDNLLIEREGMRKPWKVSLNKPQKVKGDLGNAIFKGEYSVPVPTDELKGALPKYLVLTRISNLLLDAIAKGDDPNLKKINDVVKHGFGPMYKSISARFFQNPNLDDKLEFRLFQPDAPKFMNKMITYATTSHVVVSQNGNPILDAELALTYMPTPFITTSIIREQNLSEEDLNKKLSFDASKPTMMIIGYSGALGYASVLENKDKFNLILVDKELADVPADMTGMVIQMDITGKEDPKEKEPNYKKAIKYIKKRFDGKIDVLNYALAYTTNLGFPGKEATLEQIEEANIVSFNPILELDKSFTIDNVIAYSAFTDMFHNTVFDVYGAMEGSKNQLEKYFAENGDKFKLVKGGAFFSPSFFGIALKGCNRNKGVDLIQGMKSMIDAEQLEYGNERMTTAKDMAVAASKVLNSYHKRIEVMGDLSAFGSLK